MLCIVCFFFMLFDQLNFMDHFFQLNSVYHVYWCNRSHYCYHIVEIYKHLDLADILMKNHHTRNFCSYDWPPYRLPMFQLILRKQFDKLENKFRTFSFYILEINFFNTKEDQCPTTDEMNFFQESKYEKRQINMLRNELST